MNKQSPKISVIQIAKFSKASDKAQRKMLSVRKYPKEDKFLSNWYNTPRAAMIGFMRDENHDISIFERARQNVLERTIDSKWKLIDKKNSLEAIDILEKEVVRLFKPYFNYNSKRCKRNEKIIVLYAVDIDVNPDILLFNKESNILLGGIKIVFSKSHQLTVFEGQLITSLIRRHLKKNYRTTVQDKMCIVFDVFHKKIFIAPTSDNESFYRTVTKGTCLKIVELWDKI